MRPSTSLAALAESLPAAIRRAKRLAYVILDETLPPIDRIAADRPFHPGKYQRHGMNIQVITDPPGRPRWASPALPGSTHDQSAARTHGTLDAPTNADITCFADRGYQGGDRQIVSADRAGSRPG